VGAVIIYANDPKALNEWYRAVLGIVTEFSGQEGCYHAFFTDPETGRKTPFGLMPAKRHLSAEHRAVMVNYQVDDFQSFVDEIKQKGVAVEDTSQGEYGKFAHIKDPEGNPIEIWQPPE